MAAEDLTRVSYNEKEESENQAAISKGIEIDHFNPRSPQYKPSYKQFHAITCMISIIPHFSSAGKIVQDTKCLQKITPQPVRNSENSSMAVV